MPVNNELKEKEFPMEIKFGKKPKTEFKNLLKSIDVKLIMSPRYEDIINACIPFANATWVDEPIEIKNMSNKSKDLFMYHIFARKILPQTLENISLTFCIDGITLQEVTHILRNRRATFSAECSGDKFLHDKEFLVPSSIECNKDFFERYKEICLKAKELYCDMVNSKEVNIQDARYIMPRSLETFYYMRMDLGEAIRFIYDRIDRQIQPQSDNIIAYKMMIELCKTYPILSKIIGVKFLRRKADWYCKTARQYRATNWYRPNEDNDCFEYNEKDFIYDKCRDEMPGSEVFNKIFNEVECILKNIENEIDIKYGKGFFEKDIKKEEI